MSSMSDRTAVTTAGEDTTFFLVVQKRSITSSTFYRSSRPALITHPRLFGLWLHLGRLSSLLKVHEGPLAHECLFPRCSLVIHHGGSGTTAAVLRAGIPHGERMRGLQLRLPS